MATFQIDGLDKLKRALAQAGDLATEALAAAMVEEMEMVITDAKQAAPVDTGTLRGSGTVLPPEVSGSKVTVVSGFGGAASAYAVVQHERHSSKSKFLERPFLARAGKMGSNLATRVERAWQRLKV
jgi:hypothetical protein